MGIKHTFDRSRTISWKKRYERRQRDTTENKLLIGCNNFSTEPNRIGKQAILFWVPKFLLTIIASIHNIKDEGHKVTILEVVSCEDNIIMNVCFEEMK